MKPVSITYRFKSFVLASVLLTFLFVGQNKLQANNLEIWTFVGAQTEWKKVEFSLQNANFFRGEGGWFLDFTQASFDFKTNKSIKLGIAYKQEYVKILDIRRVEYRPMLHLYYSKKMGDFQLRDRNRFEFRFFETGLVNRYRNQIMLTYKKFEKIVPYAYTEFFFYFDKLNYARQRTALGFNIPVKSVNINVFGAHQSDKISPDFWYKKFMVGTSLNYRF